jgi:hypothetical protein
VIKRANILAFCMVVFLLWLSRDCPPKLTALL